MSDSSSYLITPPSIFLPRRGLTFSLITRNSKWVENFMEMAEDKFPGTTVTFFSSHEEADVEKYVWEFQHATIADFVIVDMDSASDTDINIALIVSKGKRVWWEFADEDSYVTLQTILNVSGAGLVDSTEEFFEMISDLDNV